MSSVNQVLFAKDSVYVHVNVDVQEKDAHIAGRVFFLQKPDGHYVEWKAEEVLNLEAQADQDWAVIGAVSYKSETQGDTVSMNAKMDARRKYNISFDILDLKSFKRSAPNHGWAYIIFILKDGTTFPALHFHNGGSKALLKELEKFIHIRRSPNDQRLFLVQEHDPDMLSKSFDELNLFSESSGRLVSNFIRDPYTATMGSFSKVTNFLRDVLMSDNPHARPREEVAELLHDDIPGMEVNHQDEPGFEMVTKTKLPNRPDVQRGEQLNAQQWAAYFDTDGRITHIDNLKEQIFRGGVDPSIRNEVWKYLLGYYSWDSTLKKRQEERKRKVDDYFRMKLQWKTISAEQEKRFSTLRERKGLIDKDVSRTDRTQKFFSGDRNQNLQVLYDILMTYCMYNFDLGYVQGMSDLLSPVLVVMENEVDAFWCFAGLMERMCTNFEMDQGGMKMQLTQIQKLMQVYDPELYTYLESHDSGNFYFCFRWILIHFKREFHFHEIHRLWEPPTSASMPTSSQARILGSRSSGTEKAGTSEMTISNTMGPLINRHRSCVPTEGTLFHPVGVCNYHQPLLHMPRINLQSGGADLFMINGFGPTSPRVELNARGRAEFPHFNSMPSTPRNAFNTSNNWPNNAEDGAKESLPNTNGPTDGPSQAGTSDPRRPSGSRRMSKQGSLQRRESDAQSKRRVSGSLGRKGSKDVNRKASVRVKPASRRSTDVTNEEDEDRSFTFEVDLLKIRSSDGTSEIVEEPKPKMSTESAPKHTMKTLFKQLLSIGVMSNAFRGVTVETATGEKHGATEQETEAALQTMVTDMVEDDEDEEEDDEEEMELVMGSLLHNVGSRIEVHEDEPGVKTPPKPKPPAKPPTLITPGRHVAKPSISKTGPASKPALKPPSTQDAGWKTGGTSEMEDILAATALPAKEEAPTKEEDPEKAFLKEVLTGSLYGNKGKAPTLAPPKPEQPKKKKVFKIPPIRLRRSIPMCNPDLLAIRTPCVDLIHEQVKNMLEAQLGTIVSLQHEPEYLQTGDVPLPIRAMWIFKMEDVSVNNHTRICCTGIIDYEGETLRVRRRDDIFQEEHRAYLLVQQIKEEQANRLKNKKKPKASPSRVKSPLPP